MLYTGYLLVAVVALEEVVGFFFAVGAGVEATVVAVFSLAHEEVARVDLSIDSDLRVGHIDRKLIYEMNNFVNKISKTEP